VGAYVPPFSVLRRRSLLIIRRIVFHPFIAASIILATGTNKMHRWTVILLMAALALAVADAASTANLLLGGDDDDQRAENEWSSTYRLLSSTHNPSANSAILAALDDLPRTWDAAPRSTVRSLAVFFS
jgi:hypothetical protein